MLSTIKLFVFHSRKDMLKRSNNTIEGNHYQKNVIAILRTLREEEESIREGIQSVYLIKRRMEDLVCRSLIL